MVNWTTVNASATNCWFSGAAASQIFGFFSLRVLRDSDRSGDDVLPCFAEIKWS